MGSFFIHVDDLGNQSDELLRKIRGAVWDTLVTSNSDDYIRDNLRIALPLSKVMGVTYRYSWVDKIGRSLFIIIATNLRNEEGVVRGRPVLVWAIRRKVGQTLREICIDAILGRLKEKQDIEKLALELPRTVLSDMKETFDRK